MKCHRQEVTISKCDQEGLTWFSWDGQGTTLQVVSSGPVTCCLSVVGGRLVSDICRGNQRFLISYNLENILIQICYRNQMFRLKNGQFATRIISALDSNLMIGLDYVGISAFELNEGFVSLRTRGNVVGMIKTQYSRWRALNDAGENFVENISILVKKFGF